MSEVERDAEPVVVAPAEAPPVYFDARRELARRYLFGHGLEIGALHQPVSVPAGVTVRYVDRTTVAELRREYPELHDWNMVEADVIDDGEVLSTIADGSQDFIIANHFLEHCEDPIGTIRNHLGKLRPGGILFYAVPDKRYTFDAGRHVTPLLHVIADHEQGPHRSRSQHYDDWARFVEYKLNETADQTIARARALEAAAHSIHMHVWTQAEFLELILACRQRFDDGFDVEACARQDIEFTVVLRKAGRFPPLRTEPEAQLATADAAPVVPFGRRWRRRRFRDVVSRVRRVVVARPTRPRSTV